MLRRARVALVLLKARLQLQLLRLKILRLQLQGAVSGRDRRHLVAKHRRTATLVAERLAQFRWSGGLPVGMHALAPARVVVIHEGSTELQARLERAAAPGVEVRRWAPDPARPIKRMWGLERDHPWAMAAGYLLALLAAILLSAAGARGWLW